jgi:hypothetical protein
VVIVNASSHQRKVFGIGLSRTGTRSLSRALALLGFRSLHWPHDEATQTELMAYYNGNSPFHLTVADQYDVVADTPIASVFEELADQYRDARFVLTVRERNSWLKSCARFFSALALQEDSVRPDDRYVAAIRRRVYGRINFDAAAFSEAYDRHMRKIRKRFKTMPERLLIFDITAGEGWQQLCSFLNLPLPSASFPHENAGTPSLALPAANWLRARLLPWLKGGASR